MNLLLAGGGWLRLILKECHNWKNGKEMTNSYMFFNLWQSNLIRNVPPDNR